MQGQDDMLDQVNHAISNILMGGQSYTIGKRSLTRADLSKLYEMQEKLQAQSLAEESSDLLGDTYAAIFEGR